MIDFQILVVTPKSSKKTMDTVMDNKPLCKTAPVFQLLPGLVNLDKRNTGELIVPVCLDKVRSVLLCSSSTDKSIGPGSQDCCPGTFYPKCLGKHRNLEYLVQVWTID